MRSSFCLKGYLSIPGNDRGHRKYENYCGHSTSLITSLFFLGPFWPNNLFITAPSLSFSSLHPTLEGSLEDPVTISSRLGCTVSRTPRPRSYNCQRTRPSLQTSLSTYHLNVHPLFSFVVYFIFVSTFTHTLVSVSDHRPSLQLL